MPKGIYDHTNNKHGSGWKIKDTSKMMGKHPKSEFKKGQLLNEKNVNWKNEGYTMVALHSWVKRRLVKPVNCSNCGEIKPLDLANKSHEYKRELSDWLWLCKKCHTVFDRNIIADFAKLNPNFFNRWTGEWQERMVD